MSERREEGEEGRGCREVRVSMDLVREGENEQCCDQERLGHQEGDEWG